MEPSFVELGEDEFYSLSEKQLIKLANKIGISTKNLDSISKLRTRLLNDAVIK